MRQYDKAIEALAKDLTEWRNLKSEAQNDSDKELCNRFVVSIEKAIDTLKFLDEGR